jgi:hypothetical protein
MGSPYDLTTLAAVKAWATITNTNSDAVLAPLITAASRWVLGYVGRSSVLPKLLNERYDGGGKDRLYLRSYPVLSIASLVIGQTAISAAPTPGAGVGWQAGYLLEPWDGIPPGQIQALDLRGHWFHRGRQNVLVSYTAGYQVTGETATVPASPGPYTYTAQAPYGPWASDAGVTYANGTAMTLVTGAPAQGQYAVAAGVYTFAAADQGASVLISYGFVPQDIAQATIELIAERFSYRSRIGETTHSLGGQETAGFSLKDMPDAMKLMLQPYRNVVPMC